MGMTEERLAALEGRVMEHSTMFVDFREVLHKMEQRIDTRFAAIDQRFAAVDQRFAGIDQRLTSIERSVNGVRTDMAADFRWVVGLQIGTIVAIVGAVLGVAFLK